MKGKDILPSPSPQASLCSQKPPIQGSFSLFFKKNRLVYKYIYSYIENKIYLIACIYIVSFHLSVPAPNPHMQAGIL